MSFSNESFDYKNIDIDLERPNIAYDFNRPNFMFKIHLILKDVNYQTRFLKRQKELGEA